MKRKKKNKTCVIIIERKKNIYEKHIFSGLKYSCDEEIELKELNQNKSLYLFFDQV